MTHSLFALSLKRLGFTLSAILIIFFNPQVNAQLVKHYVDAKEITISLSADLTVPITVYSGHNKTLILWIPSEFGFAPKNQASIAQGLVKRGVDVWFADLHDAYFVQRGRNSVDKFRPQDISALMLQAIKKGYTKIILTGSAGAARPLIRTTRYWQATHLTPKQAKQLSILGGLILFHPSLYESRPEAGKSAVYIPETYATNIPIYIIQPMYSTAIYRVSVLLKAIRTSGAPVWIQFLHNIKDGFQVNVARHQRAIDIKIRQKLPGFMMSAIKRMSLRKIPKQLAALPKVRKKVKDTFPGLKPYSDQTIRLLTLNSISGKTVSIKSFRGEVLLVSFWASWCPPCIREMPSINRLALHFKGKKFRVVSVNIGESKADIRRFLAKHALHGEILMDPSLKAYREWKIFVIPSNFIIDKNGKMRYTSVGAVEWDTKIIRDTINKLIVE